MAIYLIIAILSVYRVATDLAWETGPFRIFETYRSAIVLNFGHDSLIAEGATCPICLSFWLALIAAGVVVVLGVASWGELLPLWLAIAGGAAWLARRSAA